MNRKLLLDLAAAGARLPIGTDLVLKEKGDHDAILLDGRRLGRVTEEAALRYNTPLAIPLMDLMLEKSAMLQMLDVPAEQIDAFHLPTCPTNQLVEQLHDRLAGPLSRRMQANVDAISYIAQETGLWPVGMSIGPFSLMTKLLADPITPVFMAGSGVKAAEDEEVRAVERVLEMSIAVILRSIEAQIAAGAQTIMVAEPAANKAYFSPNQLEAGSDVFDRYVMAYNRRLRQLLDKHRVGLFFHCCGELTDAIVGQFGSLHPAMLSLGSSRKLWEDAALVPGDTVLYGNLPTRKFYSDELMTGQQVAQTACELIARMQEAAHPFILGSECDVLSVPGCQDTIKSKVEIMLTCSCI